MRTLASALKAKALKLLAQRDYSRAELERKMQSWLVAEQRKKMAQGDARQCEADACTQEFEAAENQLQSILEDFQARGWINDERVIESLLHQKSGRLGHLRLQQDLQARGLDDGLIQEALSNIRETEFDRACHVWQKRFRALPSDAAGYNKQMRFLVYRGFSTEVARKVLSGQWLEN